MIADENDACLLYDLVTNVPAVGTTRMAEWLRVEGGKITSIQLYFDPRPYVAMLEKK